MTDTRITYWSVGYRDSTTGESLGFITRASTFTSVLTWMHGIGIHPKGRADGRSFRTLYISPDYLDRPLTYEDWKMSRPDNPCEWLGETVSICADCATHPLRIHE